MTGIGLTKWTVLGVGLALATVAAGTAWHELTAVRPAQSQRLLTWELSWERAASPGSQRGVALFSYGDFGALDLDTLATSAVPWPLLAASLALLEAQGRADLTSWPQVESAFKRFGFLYPEKLSGLSGAVPADGAPLGLSIGVVTRVIPPLRMEVLNVGCAACHAGPAYRADGTPDLALAVPGMPNTSLDLEAFTTTSYAAFKRALKDEVSLMAAIERLFPRMGLREKLTLRWIALPRAKAEIAKLERGIDRPLPFPNGTPGSTNGVAALKHQLHVTPRDRFHDGAGFVSIPVLADRFWRSALLADGAYASKNQVRFRAIGSDEVKARDPQELGAVASFFMVPSMGMSDVRAAAAIPELSEVMRWLRDLTPPPFPGPIDRSLAATGRAVYARACASCHGTYDASLDRPRLQSFPNWAGNVGTDRSRVEAFTPALADAVNTTLHGRKYMDAASTGQTTAPPLSGLWASAPYFVNGSVPTVRHLLEPQTRPIRFMVGGHRLDLARLGIAGTAMPDGSWIYPEDQQPFSAPVMIDTRKAGFSNAGHEAEVSGLSDADRDALIEYLKLL
jgi:mono/diheme cytochrome c family protein